MEGIGLTWNNFSQWRKNFGRDSSALASWEGVCPAVCDHRYSFMLAQTPCQQCWSVWQGGCTQEAALSVLCCWCSVTLSWGAPTRGFTGRYHCGPSTAPELISIPRTTLWELLLVEYSLDLQKSYWGCHNWVFCVTAVALTHPTDGQ